MYNNLFERSLLVSGFHLRIRKSVKIKRECEEEKAIVVVVVRIILFFVLSRNKKSGIQLFYFFS